MVDYRQGIALACVMFLLAAPSTSKGQDRRPNYNFYDSRILRTEPPRRLISTSEALRLPAPAASADPETVARAFLQDHRDLLGIESTTVFSLPLERRYETGQAGLTHLIFRRRHAGIDVFEGDVLVNLTRDGRVLQVQPGSTWPSGAVPSLAAALNADQAVAAALHLLAAGSPRAPAKARLVWFPRSADVVLAWELFLDIDVFRWYCALIDATTGDLLFSHNLYRDDVPRGSVFRAPDEVQSIESFTGWPASAESCPDPIYPPQYRSGTLLSRCWVSGTATEGNNAVACLDADGNNLCDWKATNAQADFEFPFTNSYALNGDPIPDRNAAVTNLFYWNNVLHDWLYSLGFTELAGNFQTDNFGRGGFGGDAVLADAQDGSGLNTANFATPPDGSAPRMQVFLFTNNGTFLRRDSAFDGDIITHEYVHGLTTRLVGGPGNSNVLPLWQSGAMGEGWSDAYAASFTNDPVIGEYVSATPATGIRSVAYNNSPWTYGRFGTLYRRNFGPLGLIIDVPQVHRDGEIWATVLWDLRSALGKTVFESLLTTALKLTPARPSMLDARTAILQAAQAMNVAECTVWSVFAARGFGASAALNHIQAGQANDTALSVYEAFNRPAACGGATPQPGSALFFDDVEAGPGAWTASGLWHVTSRRSAGGARSWWYGQEATGNYATGSRTAGTLTSPAIDLPTGAKVILEWDQLFKGEGFGRNYSYDPYLNYDSGWVLVSRDGGVTWDTLTTLAHNSDGPAFDPHKIDISRYAGSTIRIRFLFDSLDANENQNEGWYIDNIRVWRLLTGTPALAVAPASLSFPAAGSQTLSITNVDLGTLNWTATASSGGWLAVSPGSGTGPATLTVTVQSGTLAPGVYNGTVTVTASSATGSPAMIPVTLTVIGPVAEWHFEETGAGTGVPIAGGVTAGYGSTAVPGVAGNARLFNGFTDRVEAPPSTDLSPPSFTFRAWLKLLSYPTASGWGVLVANYGGNYQGWYLGVHSSGRVIFSVAGLPSSAPWLVSTAALSLQRWYCITTTYDGNSHEGSIYINGTLDAKAVFPGFTPQSALPLTFGRASWFDGYYLNAALDEARLYPVAQAPVQVLSDYQSFPSPPPPPANAGTMAEWHLDDAGATLTDSSGNARNGTFSGGAVTPGVRSNARTFNGVTDYAQAPASDAYAAASFTVRAWVKLLAYPQGAGWGVLISNYGGNYQGWYVGVHASGRVIFSVSSLPSSSPWILSGASLLLNRWYYLSVTYDGASRLASMCIDGLASAQAFLPGFTPAPSVPVYLGRASWYDGYYLNAAIDEVRLEPASRTPSEILSDFQSFPPPAGPAAVAEWKMDDPGGTLTDSSGNAHNGTAHGTTTTTGIRNAARSFNGVSDWIQVPASPALSSPSFTIRAWVKLGALPSGWGILLSNYGGNYQGWYLGVHASGRLILCVANLPSNAPWLVSNTALSPNTWYHLTATYEGTGRTGAIYISGVRDTDAVFPGFTAQAATDLTFARASWYDGYYLNASIDEVRLLDVPQSAAEILADFKSFP